MVDKYVMLTKNSIFHWIQPPIKKTMMCIVSKNQRRFGSEFPCSRGRTSAVQEKQRGPGFLCRSAQEGRSTIRWFRPSIRQSMPRPNDRPGSAGHRSHSQWPPSLGQSPLFRVQTLEIYHRASRQSKDQKKIAYNGFVDRTFNGGCSFLSLWKRFTNSWSVMLQQIYCQYSTDQRN